MSPEEARGEGHPPWRLLTRQPKKAALYADEAQPREVWNELLEEVGLSEAVALLRRLTVVLLKPEAMKRRLLEPVCTWSAEHGYRPLATRTVRLDELTAHALWRYQWNVATLDRIRLHLLTAEDTPTLLVAYEGDAEPVPATVRLWGLKGPSKAERREPYHLRTVLGMTNRMMGFVHCPDEPADLLRELGILFGRSERVRLLRELVERRGLDRGANVLAAAQTALSRCPPHSVDPMEVRARLTAAGRHRSFTALLDTGLRYRLDGLERAYGPYADAHDRWDFITLAAELIAHDRDGVRPVLDALAYADVAFAWE